MPTFDHIKVLPLIMEKAEAVPDESGGRKRLRISGWASTETPDRSGEVIEVGFFDDSLPEFMKTASMPWMHDVSDPQGKWDAVTPVPGKGYHVSGEVIDLGADVDTRRMAMVEEGLVASLSVGFNASYTPEYGYMDDETKTWHWTHGGKLMEVSLCTIPCNPDTSFQVAKMLGMPLLQYEAPEPQSKDDAEDERWVDDMKRLSGAMEALLNIHRHWRKQGRLLLAEHRDALTLAQDRLAELLEPYPAAAEEPASQGAPSLFAEWSPSLAEGEAFDPLHAVD